MINCNKIDSREPQEDSALVEVPTLSGDASDGASLQSLESRESRSFVPFSSSSSDLRRDRIKFEETSRVTTSKAADTRPGELGGGREREGEADKRSSPPSPPPQISLLCGRRVTFLDVAGLCQNFTFPVAHFQTSF